MRLGLVTPIVTRHPTRDAAWTADAGPEDLRAIAVAADHLGYHHLTCSEHVAVPRSAVATRGACYWDPLATFGFLAAVTTRVRFVTHVLVLGYHHPLAIAKRYGTLDRLCGGRLVLGVGVGTLAEEFALLGAPFDDRGPRFVDGLRALRAAFGRREPAYVGPHHRFGEVVVEPCGVQSEVPIWVGGRSARSLRRAVELADGWDPFGLGLDALATLLARARDTAAWQRRVRPLELVLPLEAVLDPVDPAERRQLCDLAERHRALGTTVLNCRFRHRSLAHYLEQLEAVAAELAPS
ncbi:MAG: LLM class F420-dependent oxidoreductase [bacterium]|nr:LLM class F420-dependent oxidoreductase [bacterium]